MRAYVRVCVCLGGGGIENRWKSYDPGSEAFYTLYRESLYDRSAIHEGLDGVGLIITNHSKFSPFNIHSHYFFAYSMMKNNSDI